MSDTATPFMPKEKPGDTYVQSLAKGLSVITSFCREHPRQTLSQVAQHTGLPPAGARRILLTLEKLGYVGSEGRFFFLKPRVLSLGFSYLNSIPFWKQAQEVVEKLSDNTGENCSVCVLDDTDVVFVVRVPTRKIVTSNLYVGSRVPAYASSIGRVLLAGQPEEIRLDLLQRSKITAITPYTVTDREALAAILRQTRAQGWNFTGRELSDRLASLSAPIVDRNGRWTAALNISGIMPTEGMGQKYIDNYLPILLETAGHISEMVI